MANTMNDTEMLEQHKAGHDAKCMTKDGLAHPNCQCEIVDGTWETQANCCAYCSEAATEYNAKNKADDPVAETEEKPMPEKAHVAKSKVKTTATVITDAYFLSKLNATLPIRKDTKPSDGYWAIASVENPAGDSDHDIIMVKGIQANLDPANGRYLPLLPSHMRALPDAAAAEIGRIERLVKTEVDGVPALAMYFTFALDEDGKPIDALVEGYYKRYKLGYSNTFSVGMDVMDFEPNKIGGFTYTKTKLLEVSAVSIPANDQAVGLTRAKEADTEILTKLSEVMKAIELLEGKMAQNTLCLGDRIEKELKPFEDRLDSLEANIVVQKASKAEGKKEAIKPDNVAQFNALKDIAKMLEKYK